MAKRKQCLVEFLEEEDLLQRVKDGVEMLCDAVDSHVDWGLSVWAYLEGVEVQPTRATTRYGTANYRKQLLRITELPISAWKRQDTILHEVAHLVAFHLFSTRIQGHGKEWRAAAVALGAEPSASGNDPVFEAAASRVRESRKKIVARCLECGFEILATRRTSKYRRTVYRHRGCGGTIAPVD